MINNRRAVRTLFVGMFVAASLGLGIAAKTETTIPDRNSGRTAILVSTPPTFKNSFPDYDIAAGEGFLMRSIPGLVAEEQAAIGSGRGATGAAGDTGRNVRTDRSAAGRHPTGGIFSESLTPAQISVDDAASADEERGSVHRPVDLTLAPGAYSLASIPDPAFEDGRPTRFFDPAGSGSGAARSVLLATDLGRRLYTPLTAAKTSRNHLMGLETAGWKLPAPPAGN